MRLVVDANVFFSAFLRGGLTRRLWNKREIELYAPRFLLQEYLHHAKELWKRSGQTAEDNFHLARLLLEKLNFVDYEELAPYVPAARVLTIDEKDIAYVACALAVGADLWSRDRHLRQPRVKCWSTEELAKHFGYLK